MPPSTVQRKEQLGCPGQLLYSCLPEEGDLATWVVAFAVAGKREAAARIEGDGGVASRGAVRG